MAFGGERTAVLVDPFPLWLDAVESVLARNGVTVVGRASHAEQALTLCEELRPQVLVADPAAGGIACIREATARVPGLKAIALASSGDPDQVRAAFAAGAVAYVVKTADATDVGVAVRQAFSPSLFLPGLAPVRRPTRGSRCSPSVSERFSGSLPTATPTASSPGCSG